MARLLNDIIDGNKKNLQGKPYREELLRQSGSLINEEAEFDSDRWIGRVVWWGRRDTAESSRALLC